MLKNFLISILILFLVFLTCVSVCHYRKLKNELEEKRIRADCGINFDRLAKLLGASRTEKTKKISETVRSNEKIFISCSNTPFADRLIIHREKADTNGSTPVLLISDQSSVHQDGRRHILMSDGKVYVVTAEEFGTLLKKEKALDEKN